jgi:hypothetical protein
MPDPELSQLGQEQCVGLRENLMNKLPVELRDNIGLIIVSPMRRTIETALRSMDWLLEKGVPIQAHAGWQGNWALLFVLSLVVPLLLSVVQSQSQLTRSRKLRVSLRYRLTNANPTS